VDQRATDKKGLDQYVLESWVQGFLTATNVFFTGSSDLSHGTDSEGIMAWVDNYCKEHPLETLATAAVDLVFQLMARGGPAPAQR
jgi:2-methylcitrate dehydratase PrpD